MINGIPFFKIGLKIAQSFLAHIRRVADHRVKSALFHDVAKLGLPVKGIDPVHLFLIKQGHLLMVVEVRADQGIAALDVVGQIGQDPLLKKAHLPADALLVLAFQDF